MTKRSTTEGHATDGAAPGVSRRGFVTGATTAVGAGLGTMTLAQSAAQAQDREDSRRRRGDDNRGGRGEESRGDRGRFWPNGARLAIAFSMVIETDADPDPVSKGPDGKNYPNLYAKTAEQYAANEAIPRMLDMFDRRRIKVTSMMCGQSAERNPALAKEVAQRGHECGAHGKTHDNQFQMDRDDRARLHQGRRGYDREGHRPASGRLEWPRPVAQRQHALAGAGARLHLPHRRHQPR